MAVITPKTEAHFNVPPSNPYVINDHIYDLIDSADAGSTVSISLYELGQNKARDTIRAALDRGVFFHLIIDQASLKFSAFNSPLNGIFQLVNGGINPNGSGNNNNVNTKRSSWCLVAYGGGVGDNINHDKFFLFSSVQGKKKVWVQSSCNLMNNRPWNNAVTGVNHPIIYDGYMIRLNAQKAAATTLKHHKAPYTTVDDGTFKAYFYPQPPASNTLLQILSNVTGGKGTYIDIACYLFLLPEVAVSLKRLARRGVRVRLCYTDAANESESTASIVRSATNSVVKRWENISSYTAPYNFMHSKYMIIDGEYLGKNSKIVWTGSLNFTKNALYHNDESVVRFYGPGALWDAYSNDFANLITYGQRGVFLLNVNDDMSSNDGPSVSEGGGPHPPKTYDRLPTEAVHLTDDTTTWEYNGGG